MTKKKTFSFPLRSILLITAAMWFFVQSAFAATLDCAQSHVRCVGSGQEYTTIQAAANAAVAGDTVWVHDGTYAGFRLSTSGTSSAPITIAAVGDSAYITSGMSTGDGIYLSDVNYVTIRGLKIRGVGKYCVAAHDATATAPMVGLLIQNNTCTDAGYGGMYFSQVSQSLIEGNTITGSKLSHGMYLANGGSDRTVIRGNLIATPLEAEAAALHMNGDASVGGDGLISGVLIENNVMYGGKFNGISMDGVQQAIVRNNVIYNFGKNGIRAFRLDGASGPRELTFVNNTVVVPSNGSGWAIKITEDGGGHTIFNNVLLNEGSNGGSLCVANGSFFSDNNLVVNRLSRDGDDTVLSLASWKSLTGQDGNSATASSATLFVDVSGANYHLRSGAPATNAGRAGLNSIAASASDIEGTARPQGSEFDIGAYEYVEGLSRPTAPANLAVR